jgi:hypothetical protein
LLFRGSLCFAWLLLGSCVLAQTVQPVISEYQAKADGKFALTNGTLTPMVVVPEPKASASRRMARESSALSIKTFTWNSGP